MSDEARLRQYLEKVTVDLRRANRRVQDLEQRDREPIAIVGMSCRYPGGVSDPHELWELVASGTDAISEFPADRGWDLDRLFHPDPDHLGTTYVREAGFIEGVGDFDPAFFGISPREALAMDPQQRLLLESSWEALEDAGIDPSSLRGSKTAVFAGTGGSDYGIGVVADEELEGYSGVGALASVIAGRISYTLGLEGPAMVVDTACSSSLIALHLASQALRGGECSLALAGGVCAMATPSGFVIFSSQRMLAPDGRCKSFAEGADGTIWSEGVGMLVLERLSDAQRNGHPIHAVIRGSAVNQDGASNGLAAPNGPSQQRVIRQALSNAGLSPVEIDTVEAHGTGTMLGDPIEAQALLATYGQERETPLKLGSIKSNIGHAQAAAGVAGVIKMAMAMREGLLPKTLHVDEPSSKIDWEAGAVELLTETQPWQKNGKPRRAGISSFGVSGTNAHVILEEAPEPVPAGELEDNSPGSGASEGNVLKGPIPLALSAKTVLALEEAASRLAAHLSDNPDLDPIDVAHSLLTTRASFEHRAVALGSDREELLASLASIAEGAPSPNVAQARARQGKLAYLLTGQGSQRAGMGNELYEVYPVYREALEEITAELDSHLDRPLKELLFATEGSKEAKLLDHTTYAQPALFATEVSLYRLLESFGLKPDFLAGHSIGEIAAAYIAGVFSLDDACKLVAARGKLMGALPEGGAMTAIEATEQEVAEALEGKDGLSIAAINSPSSVVISGEQAPAEEIQAHFEAQGKKTKRLAVSHAFHSHLMEPMLDEFAEVAQSLDYQEPQIPIVSTQSGELLDPTKAQNPAYWVAQVRAPVRFADAVTTLKAKGTTTYLELGPEAVLSAMASACLQDDEQSSALIPTLREGRPELGAVVSALASAHVSGAKLDWDAYFEGTGAKRVPLPTYPFQRKRYWVSASAGAGDPSTAGQSAAGHPLLAAAVQLADARQWLLTGRISLSTHPWLKDHAIAGAVLLPGAAFVELALRAGEEVGAEMVEELALQAPLVLPESGATQIQVFLADPDERGRREISIHSRPEPADGEEAEEWTCNASGVLSPESPAIPDPPPAWPPEGAEPIEVSDLYDRLAEAGFEYGPAFQGLTAAWRLGEEIYAEVSLDEERGKEAGRFAVHPALLDATLSAILLGEAGEEMPRPVAWSGLHVHTPGAAPLRVCLSAEGEAPALAAFDASGAPVLSIDAIESRPVDEEQLQAARRRRQSLFSVRWSECRHSASGSEQRFAIVGDLEVPGLEAERHDRLAGLIETVEQGAEPPHAVLLRAPSRAAEALPMAAQATVEDALELVQAWAAADSLAAARLVLLTERAQAILDGETPDLGAASLWGLLRSACSEYPGRFALLDSDGSETSTEALAGALIATDAEPQLALRDGLALVPRLTGLESAEKEPTARPVDPDSTVLITGGTGGIGSLVARHLALQHGARRLLLVSRSGETAAGAAELKAELERIGAEVTVAACDVSDRKQLEALIDSVPVEHPLGAVIHTAAVLADGTIDSLGPEQIETAFAPKASAAWHLHELTAERDLAQFLLFSSIAATLGNAAQSSYSAANSFLDALAAHRRAQGLPATTLAWGPWGESGMLKQLSAADRARLERFGFAAVSPEQGLEAFDVGRARGEAHLVLAEPNGPALRAQASAGMLPAILSGMVRVPAGRRTGSLARRLAAMPEAEREAAVLELVRTHAASVLGGSFEEVEPERAFQELGFDSLAAVELRTRLAAATGLRLPATLVFDYPSAAVLARFLLAEVGGVEDGGTVTVTRVAASEEEPVAIVGMACRYPGGANSPEALWELVAEGVDAIAEFPSDRGWPLDRIYHPDPEHPGTSYAREGGFIDRVADFDAGFFGISPLEAKAMDPQQRFLLETCWEAFEDAGIDPLSLRGSETGVFVGASAGDYGLASLSADSLDGFSVLGSSSSVVSGRISYTLGLEGPAMTIDTACSSSLVALHLACQALGGGECSLALAGGIAVFSTPSIFVGMSRQRALAPDGRSKAFSEAADGTGAAEGVGVLVVERLSDAHRNGHPVLGLVRGSAVNQDGASNGLTAPNGPSQQRVIRQALASARLTPDQVSAVEAHGTGTALGDPIEAGALLATYGQEREEPLHLGSIKSNIGHPQAAAGMAGVIKMTMAMREGVLPKTLHADEPSSRIEWSAGAVELLTESREWEPNGHPRRAAVSSFGVSGTNAHVILEEPPASPHRDEGAAGKLATGDAAIEPSVTPLLLSAKSEPALRAQAARMASRLSASPSPSALDLGYSLVSGRARLERRAIVLGGDRAELLSRLGSLERGEATEGLVQGRAGSGGKVAFFFTGYGSQWDGMALELLESAPAFARHMRACEEALEPHLDWSLEDVLRGVDGAPPLGRVDVGQPVLFAVMSSLAALWRRCGVEPSVVVGHSQGEVTAAYVAGGLSLEDAATAVVARSRILTEELAGQGALVSVGLSAEQVESRLGHWDGRIEVAALNGPVSTVLSGERAALDELMAQLEGEGVRARNVPGAVAASHSVQVERLREKLIDALAPISPRSGEIPFHSTVSGELVDTADLDVEYWYRNMRQTVRLEPVVRSLLGDGYRALIEMGPHPVLAVGLQETVDAAVPEPSAVAVLGSLRRGEGGLERFAHSLAEADAAGVEVDWGVFFEGSPAKRVKLPTYPFQRKRYWFEPAATAAEIDVESAGLDHPVLAPPTESSTDGNRSAFGDGGQPDTSLSRRLAALPAEEQEGLVLELVREQLAELLGHASAEDVEPDRPLLELGLDSIGAMSLRKGLIASAGVELPVATLLEGPTAVGLARHLLALLEGSGAAAEDGGAGSTFLTLLRETRTEEDFAELIDLIAAASRFRATFDDSAFAEHAPQAVRLAEGGDAPGLFLLPSVAAMSGPQEYARFAAQFRGRRDVLAFAAPGFLAGEQLPSSVAVSARAQAEAILRCDPPAEFALAGHSSGGWLAHAVAGHLESRGIFPSAVILLDTYLQGDDVFAWLMPRLMSALREDEQSLAAVDDTRLTAMTGYFRIFAEWQPDEIAAPVTMIRASQPMTTMEPDDAGAWRASWSFPHDVMDVPGDHFSMTTDHAETTARAVQEVLGAHGAQHTPRLTEAKNGND